MTSPTSWPIFQSKLVHRREVAERTMAAAQARGGFRVLAQRDRRALRVHLGADVGRSLDVLHEAIEGVLT